ncbi:hypothetical protein MMC31_002711, partial [Peltigera leucophlebia]|nr:hypothetical protein [Peltigera leucophlebia]
TLESPKCGNISSKNATVNTPYVFLHQEERALKSKKWAPRALKVIFVDYDGHTIYRVFIRYQIIQNKVIRVKYLQILEDYETKASTNLPDYNSTPTFQGFLIEQYLEQKGLSLKLLVQAQRSLTQRRNKKNQWLHYLQKADKTENAKEPMAVERYDGYDGKVAWLIVYLDEGMACYIQRSPTIFRDGKSAIPNCGVVSS